MKKSFMILLICSSLLAQERGMRAMPQEINAEKRIALVIGNSAYKDITPLKNPANDARAMAAALRSIGFEVTAAINANKREMREAINKFGNDIRGSGVGLFYYAGHGVQSGGRNYLIPVTASIQSEGDVEDEAVSVDQVLSRMGDAQNRMNIVILDACRNNPFSTFRSVSGGLTQMVAPSGTFIAYATAPGSIAEDGNGANGIYTQALLKEIQLPGVQLEDVFKSVLSDVKKQTEGKQVPWTASSIEGRFYFVNARSNTSSTEKKNEIDSQISTNTPSMNNSDSERSLQSLWINKRYTEVIPIAQKLLKDNPASPNLLRMLAYASVETKNYDDGIQYYIELQKVDALKEDDWKKLGMAYFETKNDPQAANAMEEILKLDPTNSALNFELGVIYMRMKQWTNAASNFEKRFLADPTNFSAYYNYAACVSALGDFDKAGQAYLKAIPLKPDFGGTYYNLASCYMQLKRWEDAQNTYLKFIRLSETTKTGSVNELAIANKFVGLVFLLDKKYEDAVEYEKISTGLNDNDADSHTWLGQAYHNLQFNNSYPNAREDAIKEYKRALEINRNNIEARKLLRMLEPE